MTQQNLIDNDDEAYEDAVQDLGSILEEITLLKNTIERFVGFSDSERYNRGQQSLERDYPRYEIEHEQGGEWIRQGRRTNEESQGSLQK